MRVFRFFTNSIRFSVSYMSSILLSQKSPKKSFTYIGTKKAKNSHLKIKFFQKNLKAAETAPKSEKSGYIIVLNCGRSVFPLPGSVQAADKQYTVLHRLSCGREQCEQAACKQNIKPATGIGNGITRP